MKAWTHGQVAVIAGVEPNKLKTHRTNGHMDGIAALVNATLYEYDATDVATVVLANQLFDERAVGLRRAYEAAKAGVGAIGQVHGGVSVVERMELGDRAGILLAGAIYWRAATGDEFRMPFAGRLADLWPHVRQNLPAGEAPTGLVLGSLTRAIGTIREHEPEFEL